MSQNEIWVDVFRDTFCKLSLSAAQHFIMADVYNDGNNRLVALHAPRPKTNPSNETCTKTLRIFSGTNLEKEVIVKSTAGHLADIGQGLLAVAGGGSVHYFKELNPYFKFELKTLPSKDTLTAQEADIWSCLAQRDMDCASAVLLFKELQEIQQLSASLSHRLLGCQSISKQQQFLEEHLPRFNTRTRSFAELDCITCVTVIKKDTDAQGTVVLGTELGFVVWMDDTGTKEAKRFQMGGPVQYLCPYNHQTVVVCCRNGLLQSVGGTMQGINTSAKTIVQLSALCCGVVTVGGKIFVGHATKTVDCIDLQGRKAYALEMENAIRSLTPMYIASASAHCLLVLLQTGEMIIYHNQNRLSRFSLQAPVAAVTVGRYGTEECVLASVLKDGSLDIKVLKRNFDLSASKEPLRCPKDPLAEVSLQEETIENADSDTMHISFQQNLQQLKLETIKAYSKVIADGEGSFAKSKELQLQFNAEVRGLGPKFQIRMEIANVGKMSALHHLALCFSADAALYHLHRKHIRLPCLVRGHVYTFNAPVECTGEGERMPGNIKVVVIQRGFTYPILMASIKMPLCQSQENDL